MFNTERRIHRSLYIFTCLVLAAGVAGAAEPDSDQDGLSDAREIAVGLDPHAVDSNMDGISDLDAYRAMQIGVSSRALLSQTAPAGPTADADGDGIRDFLETYGYYRQDNQLVALKRIIPKADWNDLVARGKVGGYNVYEFATKALRDTLLARYDEGSKSYVVDIAAAYPVLRARFIAKGIPETSVLITGSTAERGSIAAIMAELVTGRGYQAPTDSLGRPLSVYFTHPLRRSTDQDPYSDYEEAMGIDGAGTAESPADHPLVAALPAIRASLVKYRLTDISSTATTLGVNFTQTDMESRTVTHSRSHGLTVSVAGTVKFGTANEYSMTGTIGTTNEWSDAKATLTGSQTANGTFSQQADTTSAHCFAKLRLTVKLENVGSDMASNIQTTLGVYLDDGLWQTVPVTYPHLNLKQRESVEVTLLGQEAYDAGCLTLRQVNYLQQRGAIGISTVLADANINVFDPRLSTIVQTGSWNAYRAKIENELARINLNVITTSGAEIVKSFWVVAAAGDYPHLGISVEDVLGRLYKRVECSAVGAVACFATESGDIVLTEAAAVDFSFYDESGQMLPASESHARYLAMAGDHRKPLSKIPTRRSVVTIVQHIAAAPIFSHAEVLGQFTSTTGSAPILSYQIRALVTDFYGIEEEGVRFCPNGADLPCSAMTRTAGDPTSGLYEMTLGERTFTGTETLVATSIHSEKTTLSLKPGNFFLAPGASLYDRLTEYAKRLADKLAAIEAFDLLRGINGDEYHRIIREGLMVGESESRPAANAWGEVLKEAQRLCGYAVSSTTLDPTECFNYIRKELPAAFNQDIPVYNWLKLPFLRRVDGIEKAWDTARNGYVAGIKCQLQPGQYLVGVDLAKSNGANTPTAWLRYVTWDAKSGTLSAPAEMTRCGPNTGRDRSYNTPGTGFAHKANLILEVGASIGGSSRRSKKNGQVTGLCVSYRTFDFRTLQFEGDGETTSCDSGATVMKTEAHTGTLTEPGVPNLTEPLFGLIVGGGANSEFQLMRGIHLKDISRKYDYRPWHTLTSGGKYRIESAAGKVLTVKGVGTSGRDLTLTGDNGSEDQVWTVEAVNDREFRLAPASYTGFLTQTGRVGTPAWVSQVAESDSKTVNYLQHWRLEQLPGGEYLIESVFDPKQVLAEDLTLQAFSNSKAGQQWHFVRLDATPELISAQVKDLRQPSGTATTVWLNKFGCTILASSDATGKPQYFNHLTLNAILDSASRRHAAQGTQIPSMVEIVDDERRVLATKAFNWPTGNAANQPSKIDISFERYASTKEVRICGAMDDPGANGLRIGAELQSVEIEAMCKSPATAPGPAVEACKVTQTK